MIVPKSRVYFAKCDTVFGLDMGVVKVGLSHSPMDRVKAVSNGPFVCSLICDTPGDMFLEHFCHMWLHKDRIGGEYFKHSVEVTRLVDSIIETGSLPFPIKFVQPEGVFVELDVASYMDAKGISFRDIEKASGVSCQRYRKVLEKQRYGSRKFLAALAVTAVKHGHTIKWSRDFKPPLGLRSAA